MTPEQARAKFVATVSHGPTRLPVPWVIEAFDIVFNEYVTSQSPVLQEPKELTEETVSAAAVQQWQAQKEAIIAARQRDKAEGKGPRVVQDDMPEVKEDE